MQPNETQNHKEQKGLLKRPVTIWKLTLPAWLLLVLGGVFLCVGIYAIGPESPDLHDEAADPAPVDARVPPHTPSPMFEILRIIEEALGEVDSHARVQTIGMEDDGWISIEWIVGDYPRLIQLQRKAESGVRSVAEALCDAGYCDGLTMRGLNMNDRKQVVIVEFSPETLAEIDWITLQTEDIYDVADSVWLNPEFPD